MPYVTPTGGSREPTPKPAPAVGRITMAAWRQPVGGVRPASPATAATRR
jgi:hypothetical protein